jgi:hypothetical protein
MKRRSELTDLRFIRVSSAAENLAGCVFSKGNVLVEYDAKLSSRFDLYLMTFL